MSRNFPDSFPLGENLIVRKVAEAHGLPHYAIYRLPEEEKVLEFRIEPEDVAHREFTAHVQYAHILTQSPALISRLVDNLYGPR